MNTEQKIRHTLGDLVITNIALQTKIEELQAEIDELKKKAEPSS